MEQTSSASFHSLNIAYSAKLMQALTVKEEQGNAVFAVHFGVKAI